MLSLGMRLNPLLKGNVSSADIDNVVQNIRKEPEYKNINLIDFWKSNIPADAPIWIGLNSVSIRIKQSKLSEYFNDRQQSCI